MAIDYYAPINLSQNELQNAALQNLAVAPSTPVAGQVYYDTASGQLRVYAEGRWRSIATTVANVLLLEAGGFALLETGDDILLESNA